jgi:hypothetical protein
MDPARKFKESLTSRPELENSQGHSRPTLRVRLAFDVCFSPESDLIAGWQRNDAMGARRRHSLSFDQLVGAGKQAWWNFKSQRLGSRKIDN